MELMLNGPSLHPGSYNQNHASCLQKCLQETLPFVFRASPDPESKSKQSGNLTSNSLF